MTLLAILFLILAVGCYAIRELYYHGKLKWQDEKKPLAFWGKRSDLRKYKSDHDHISDLNPNDLLYEIAPSTWYYKFNSDLKYKEKFPLSGTLLVWTTDGPHFFQMLFFTLLSLGITFLIGWNVWLFIGIMIATRLVNWLTRKLFSKVTHGNL